MPVALAMKDPSDTVVAEKFRLQTVYTITRYEQDRVICGGPNGEQISSPLACLVKLTVGTQFRLVEAASLEGGLRIL